ncbi:MAG: ester cyclase [Candidatus Korobacteraceae bacterium]|jgi:steroid delta-isomerase-like uncharacterized protein
MRKRWCLLLWLLACLPLVAQPAGEQERNKQISRSFFEEVLDQGQFDKYAASHAPDFVAHAGDHDATLEEDIAAAKEERKALPDMRVHVNQMIAEGDLVAVYWTAAGTNTQAGMGFPATGRKIEIDGMTFFRFKAGKIREEWSAWDMLSVMRQAGLSSSPH